MTTDLTYICKNIVTSTFFENLNILQQIKDLGGPVVFHTLQICIRVVVYSTSHIIVQCITIIYALSWTVLYNTQLCWSDDYTGTWLFHLKVFMYLPVPTTTLHC